VIINYIIMKQFAAVAIPITSHSAKKCIAVFVIGKSRFAIMDPVQEEEASFVGPLEATRSSGHVTFPSISDV
jgi:hypothetical protein